ncbi:hypothetical protein PF005_g6468 [Phytophthora fragariae]|uniref:Uncharacterized protein n=2 Tax=Phytophthora TaxID=4783 RepID=A0A6A3LKX9_9STRA|nr:hypothetical protein PF003_g26898 [Phytophthora fragariae]KAE9029770.1 hypothetical protein PR001_g11437 [Phytophthora rubi]KAE8942874.1 hypothetical protein PF009_g7387 [Phytophthora fragariae]KAE9020151.1 hypothetical protein PF011_g5544 [Phytophthora fragariae]KAE9031708.1 hypothetical protein PR002_g9561 [Phytophthora rubi]
MRRGGEFVCSCYFCLSRTVVAKPGQRKLARQFELNGIVSTIGASSEGRSAGLGCVGVHPS